MTEGYDLIGDIHGHGEALIDLLESMGYENRFGVYAHPSRTAIFLGDLIDRGPCQKLTLDIVMAMVRRGSALAVMGNHEFNALGYHTKHADFETGYLRAHNRSNTFQHQAFLDAYAGPSMEADIEEVLDFFYSLPLWLNLPGLRAIHACWDRNHQARLSHLLDKDNRLLPGALPELFLDSSLSFESAEILLKGVEHELPSGASYLDKDGTPRHATRVAWWEVGAKNLGDVAIPVGHLDADTASIPISGDRQYGYPKEEKPLFLGHYWLQGHPERLSPNVACLDYSVAKGGRLVAYRFDGEKEISNEKFFFITQHQRSQMASREPLYEPRNS